MAGYKDPGKARAARAISSFFGKKEPAEEVEVEEEDIEEEEDTLKKRITKQIAKRMGI